MSWSSSKLEWWAFGPTKGSSFLKTLTDAHEDEGESNDDSCKTIAFYRHGDSQKYAALGSTPNYHLTRGQRFKCSVKFARQKVDVPSILRDTWQRTHDTDSHPRVSSSLKTASLRRSHLFNPAKVATVALSSQKQCHPCVHRPGV